MIKVKNAESGHEAWVRPEHVSKVFKRIDGVTMLRMSNGETMISDEPADTLAQRCSMDIAAAIINQTQALRDIGYKLDNLFNRPLATYTPAYASPSYAQPYSPSNYWVGQSLIVDQELLNKLQLADQIKALG